MDTFSPKKRSEIMRRVRGKDTTPEIVVRSLLHRLGFRFRLHRADLPGKPDIVLPKYKTVIFVHGCFWHRHAGCSRASTPASRRDYWIPKFRRTIDRDRQNRESLRRAGWKVIVVWECELRDMARLAARLPDRIKKDRTISPPQDQTELAVAEQETDYQASAHEEKTPPGNPDSEEL